MATIAFVWELGFGFGHTLPIRQYCALLSTHTVFVILKSIQGCDSLFDLPHVHVLQAPSTNTTTNHRVDEPECFAHLLNNNGFAQIDDIRDRLRAWRSIFDLINPDLVLFEHSPTALLATRSDSFKKALLGTGFTCPPSGRPFGVFYPETHTKKGRKVLREFEADLLKKIHAALIGMDISSKLNSLDDLYTSVDLRLLTTFPELDHFRVRYSDPEDTKNQPLTAYIGPPSTGSGTSVGWPGGAEGTKIFLYSHNFPELPYLLQALAYSKQPTIVYSSSIHFSQLKQFESDTLIVSQNPPLLKQIAQQCDFAITNGNFNTTSQLLLKGVPILALPLQQEQYMFSQRISSLGVCRIADHNKRQDMMDALQEMSDDGASFKRATAALKDLYLHSPRSELVFNEQIENLLRSVPNPPK